MVSDTQRVARASRGESVEAASLAIRDLITSRQLVPGQQLRQDDLALRIGLSRGPTREALQALSKEGIVCHEKNRGYVVTRFDFSEMQQLYKLRELMEGEVIRSLPLPTPDQVAELRAINEEIHQGDNDLRAMIRLNESFHFGMFAGSPLKLTVSEIERLWRMSSAYLALAVAAWPSPGSKMADAHDAILDAFEAGDVDAMVTLSSAHRETSLERIRLFLA